ncbi:pyridoxamine 5'-phosphate oxidase family protein [Nonomuraea sp. NPDC047897]|uniref:pyridoxamine 5'-phosphate oxidase family protein n=1 Tax=Nonomuraea sp. NPDC047897 TaxID=3364346 RepID=UPI0037160AFC
MTDHAAWDIIRTTVSEAQNYWICTVRPDGRPHAVPVWGVWWRDSVVFSTINSSVKAANLRTNSNANVHLESAQNVVTMDGPAAELTDEAELIEIGALFDAKYAEIAGVTYDLVAAHAAGMTICAVRPEVVRAWRADDMLGSSRFTFDVDGNPVLVRSVPFEAVAEETTSA